MQKSKHTPGPWQWDEPSNWHGLDARVWVCEPYGVVAQVPIEAWRPKSVGRANAALIAAAPELLEALKTAEPLLTELCSVALNQELEPYLPYGLLDKVKSWLQSSTAQEAIRKAEAQ